MAITLNNYIPDIFIAGGLPYKGHSADEVVYHNAAFTFDDEDVNIIVKSSDTHVYYLAAHAKDFPGKYPCGTSLASALPGMPLHQGDGLYTYTIGVMLACVSVKTSNNVKELKSFLVSNDMAEKYANDNNLKIYNTNNNPPIEWKGYRLAQLQKDRGIIKGSLMIGSFIALPLIIIWIFIASEVSHITNSSNTIKNKVKEVMVKNINNIKFALLSSPIDKFLGEITNIGVVVTKNKGFVEVYKVEGGESFWIINLPEWVVASEYSHLNGKLKVTNSNNRITVKKGGL